jgi:predicted amidohydrolase YtcJ
MVVLHGVVRTLDRSDTVVEALAIKHGRIVGVGASEEIAALASDSTEVIDARGRAVLPGFIDGHVHFNSSAIENAYLIDLLTVEPTSLDDVLSVIRRQADAVPAGTWIRADNLNPDHFATFQMPTREQLDAVAPDHPAVVYTIGFHVAAANSRALANGGINEQTVDPPGGHIERDSTGRLNGILHERGKLLLDPRRADTVLPRYDLEARKSALRSHFGYLHERGVTSINDMVVDPEEIRAYQELRAAGELSIRVQLLVRGVESQIATDQILGVGLQPGLGDDWVSFGGVKLSIDGVCVAKNAATYDPYPGEPDNCGIIRIEQAELNEQVLQCHRAGVRVAIHAIGPRAVDMALDAIEHALAAHPRPDHRHRIEHAYLPGSVDQRRRMASLGVVVSTQPAFLHGLGDGWRRIWGEDGLSGVLPLRSMLDAGVTVMGSTDYPCVPADPLLGLVAATARTTKKGAVLDSSEAIGIREALRLQTTSAAFGAFQEDRKGSIELGKLADFVILSQDPTAVPAGELGRVTLDLTAIGGRIVFERAAT